MPADHPSSVSPEPAVSSPRTDSRTLVCGEVRGGNVPVHTEVTLPGLNGVLYSRPCRGARGGDVHYLSVCGSGLLSRVCIADVAGHGEVVAAVSARMHDHLRKSVDVIDERRVFRDMDRRLQEIGIQAMTTAALITYYPPSRRFTVSYAGHPPGWVRSGDGARWRRLEVAPGPASPMANLPLGTGFESTYARERLRLDVGDRLVLVTDGVLDADNAADHEFGVSGVEQTLDALGAAASIDETATALLDALARHVGTRDFVHDDVTIFVGEIAPSPPGPALWHVLKNRLLRRAFS